MSKRPQDTSAEEPDGGNPHIRFRGGPRLGDRPGLLNKLVKVALLVRLEAKPGKESAVAKLLEGALPLANQENTTPVWFALRLGPSTFGIFDAFSDDAGRKAHLAGPIAAALMANAAEMLTKAPEIEQVDLLAVKLPT